MKPKGKRKGEEEKKTKGKKKQHNTQTITIKKAKSAGLNSSCSHLKLVLHSLFLFQILVLHSLFLKDRGGEGRSEWYFSFSNFVFLFSALFFFNQTFPLIFLSRVRTIQSNKMKIYFLNFQLPKESFRKRGKEQGKRWWQKKKHQEYQSSKEKE